MFRKGSKVLVELLAMFKSALALENGEILSRCLTKKRIKTSSFVFNLASCYSYHFVLLPSRYFLFLWNRRASERPSRRGLGDPDAEEWKSIKFYLWDSTEKRLETCDLTCEKPFFSALLLFFLHAFSWNLPKTANSFISRRDPDDWRVAYDSHGKDCCGFGRSLGGKDINLKVKLMCIDRMSTVGSRCSSSILLSTTRRL